MSPPRKKSIRLRQGYGGPAKAPARPPSGGWVAFVKQHERRAVLILCALAALRVLIFAAAFPFFNNVDEGAHFDLICKYSMGHIPTHIEHYSEQTARRISYSFSPEYFDLPPGVSPSRLQNPVWLSMSRVEVDAWVAKSSEHVRTMTNHESTQPPLYYVLMAIWFRLGKLLHLDGGHLLYWLKLIDVFVYGALVWVAYLFVSRFYARNDFIRLGVPLLLVVFPQDVFYSLNNDVLTPLLFGLAFYRLIETYVGESKSYGFHAVTGLLVAAAFINKFTNLAILIAFGAILILRLVRAKTDARKLGLAFLTAAVPIGLLLIRNRIMLGDFAGAAAKIQRMGWTPKPFHAIWHHPIFTPAGVAEFWSGVIKTYWRGEFVWYGKALASGGVDLFYVISTTVFIAASIAALWVLKRKTPSEERFASVMGLWVFGLSLALLAALSTLYDYGSCVYPSRAHPFLVSGRLLSGTLIPFAALYLGGLDFILEKVGLAGRRWLVLFAIMAVILISEIIISVPAFDSLYNWYHMF